MKAFSASWAAYLDRQHQSPSGLVGQFIAERMVRQHAPETHWSIALLNLQPTDRILEIGFGAGRALALAVEQAHHGRITGMDLSPTMIRAATRRNRTAIEHGQLCLLRGTIGALPFGQRAFDKLFSIHTFYFWPEPHTVCRHLVSLLAEGGRLVSTLATAHRQANGEWSYWDVQQAVAALVKELDQCPGITATLEYGPDSRDYNNVAIVIDKP